MKVTQILDGEVQHYRNQPDMVRDTLEVETAKGKLLVVELWREKGRKMPTSFELYEKGVTNADGYYATGSLSFDGHDLIDYDGVFCLPRAVAYALIHKGFTVSDDCLATPLNRTV